MLSENLVSLRKKCRCSQEEAAEWVGVSRQALAKWENGETVPDIEKCRKLAELYHVSLDELAGYQQEKVSALPPAPKGKHIFGTVTVGEKGQIVIPKKARKIFRISSGDTLIVLGDESQGLALMKVDELLDFAKLVQITMEDEQNV